MRQGLVLLSAACMAAVSACSSTQSLGPGPLDPVDKSSWSPTVRVGQLWTDGMNVLHLSGNKSAVVDNVRLVSPSASLKLVGAALSNKHNRATEQFVATWPPKSSLIPASTITPAKGATIRPGQNYELLLGIKATKPGYMMRKGVEVDYHIGNTHYARVLESWMGVCTSKKYWRKDVFGQKDCPVPKGFHA